MWLATILSSCRLTSQPEISEALLWTGKGFVSTHWGGLCRRWSLYDNVVTNP